MHKKSKFAQALVKSRLFLSDDIKTLSKLESVKLQGNKKRN